MIEIWTAMEKPIFKLLLQEMIEGRCDLDILMGPLFLRFSRPTEGMCPGLGCSSTNIPNLITAFSLVDAAEPDATSIVP